MNANHLGGMYKQCQDWTRFCSTFKEGLDQSCPLPDAMLVNTKAPLCYIKPVTNKLNRTATNTQRIQTTTRLWANAQPDGRPAEHRWRPLFNAAKFS